MHTQKRYIVRPAVKPSRRHTKCEAKPSILAERSAAVYLLSPECVSNGIRTNSEF